MSVREHRLEAILAIRDENFSSALNKAQKSLDDIEKNTKKADGATKGFIETMKGTAIGIAVASGVAKGFDMIRASVDRAFARIDTMDNFNRSMILMTGSQEKVRQSLAKIKEDVTGTAYGLDTASKAVQGLTSSGIELGKSTKFVGGWMDAVSTYGDGTDQTLQNVTFQLTQMSAKGKANLGDLKSAMEAGIPVVKIYAEATGQSVEQVSKDISDGKIKATEFMETMDKAFREGTASFKGIEGMSKKAGNSWAGTFSNMRAAVTRGMQAVIQGFEDGAKAAEMPGLKDTVKTTGQEIEKGLKLIGQGANFVGRNLKTLAPIIITGTEAWIAYHTAIAAKSKWDAISNAISTNTSLLKASSNATRDLSSVSKIFYGAMKDGEQKEKLLAAAKKLNIELTTKDAMGLTRYTQLTEAQKVAILGETGAISAKSLAMGVLNGSISLSTALTTGLKAAWAANPLGMIAIGAVAVFKALQVLNNEISKNPAELQKVIDVSKKQIDANNELIKSAEELNRGYQGTNAETKAKVARSEDLAARLEILANKTNRTANEEKEFNNIIKQLNANMPELNLKIDEKTGKLNKNSAEIKRNIEVMKQHAEEQAKEAYLMEAYKKKFELQDAFKKSKERLDALEKSGGKWISTLSNIRNISEITAGQTTEDWKEAEKSFEGVKKELNNVNSTIQGANVSFEQSSETMIKNSNATKEQSAHLDELKTKYGVTSTAIDDYAKAQGKSTEDIGSEVLKLSQKYGVSTDSIINSVSNTGTSLKDWEKTQSETLKTNSETLQRFLDVATSGFDALEQKSSISLDKYLENLKKNAQATQNWSTNVNALMKIGISEGIIKELSKLGPAGATQAQVFIDELIKLNNGSSLELGKLTPAAEAKLKELKDAYSVGFKSASNAADTQIEMSDYHGKGETIGENLKNGMSSKQEAINRIAKDLAVGAEDNLKPVTRPNGEKAGQDMADGLGSKKENTNRIANEIKGGIEDNLNPTTHPKGVQAGRDLVEGLGSQEGNVRSTAGSLARVLENNIVATGTYDIGLWAGQGLANGLWDKEGEVSRAASYLGNLASSAMGAVLQINSPSKVTTQIGKFTGEGLELGILSMKDDVRKAGTLLGLAAVPDVPINDFATPNTSSFSSSTAKNPAVINLSMGGNVWSAFVNSISDSQSSELRLSSAY